MTRSHFENTAGAGSATAACTPYDTGDRLEPHLWVSSPGHTIGAAQRPAMPDDYGRVDFDDDEGHTVATVFFGRTATGYALHIDANEPVTIATAPAV